MKISFVVTFRSSSVLSVKFLV